MSSSFAGTPIIPLNRPQYVPTPEAFISALAWKEFDVTRKVGDVTPKVDVKPLALRYSHTSAGKSKVMEVRETKPRIEDDFSEELMRSGFISSEPRAVARAILESVSGVRVERSGIQPASPLSPSIALAQNLRGLQGVANPPDIAGILEAMFTMGTEPSGRKRSVSSLWKQAAETRLELDPLLRRIDETFDAEVLDNPRMDLARNEGEMGDETLPFFGTATPFAWFSRSWSKLTSDEWVAALPARVWVDWATTVTRMAFGMGYLWESAWYDAIAREALMPSGQPDVLGRVAQAPLVAWRPATNAISVRDVASTLKWRVNRGIEIRAFLEEFPFTSSEVNSQALELRQNRDAIRELTRAVQSNKSSGSGKNAWEAVRYALRTRESAADAADYYGLLTSRSRYLLPSPGTEWMAVIASLSADGPGGQTEVASVMRELRSLGLRPELGTLIQLLERSGLARGSADADQGVLVQSAF